MDNDKNIPDFMAAFLSRPEPELDKDYYRTDELYRERFGHGVPRAMLPDSITLDEIRKAMEACLESGQDNLLELLGVEINRDYLY